ncbi:hypothetical protein D3C73_1549810 [compost metagenome]
MKAIHVVHMDRDMRLRKLLLKLRSRKNGNLRRGDVDFLAEQSRQSGSRASKRDVPNLA